MDVVILCGGLGTRLRSISGEHQKTMMKVGDRPFMDIIIDDLARQGLRRFILCTGYQSDEVIEYYKRYNRTLEFVFSAEQEPLGTGGALLNAKKFIHSEPFLLLNGDSFIKIHVLNLKEFHQKHNALVTMAVSEARGLASAGALEISENARITQFEEKSDKMFHYYNAGIYCFSQNIWSQMPQKNKYSLEYDVFPDLVLKNEVFAFIIKDQFIDIGTSENYKKAQKVFKQ